MVGLLGGWISKLHSAWVGKNIFIVRAKRSDSKHLLCDDDLL